METLIKHMRVRFSGIGQETQDTPNNSKERRLPLQKTQSFKGGNKKQGWLKRQFSGEMISDNEASINNEYATAIAAAAAAILSIEESQPHKKSRDITEISVTKTPSRRDDTNVGTVSRRFSISGKEANTNEPPAGEISMKKAETVNQKGPDAWTDNERTPKKAPSIKRAPTNQTDTTTTKFGARIDTRQTEFVKFPDSGNNNQHTTISSGVPESKADAWEKAQMAKVNSRYERMASTILSWEKDKKAKAKRRMDVIESEVEKRRSRATQRYRNDMERIDKVAGGARAVAEDKRRDDITKTKEKANKIRSTGRIPRTCCCF